MESAQEHRVSSLGSVCCSFFLLFTSCQTRSSILEVDLLIGSVGKVPTVPRQASLGVMDNILASLQQRNNQIQPLIDLVNENNKIVRAHEALKSEVVRARQEIQVLNRELSVKENSVEKVKTTLSVVLSRLSRDRL